MLIFLESSWVHKLGRQSMEIVSRALLKHRLNPTQFGRVCLEESKHRVPTPAPLDAALQRLLQEKIKQKQPGTVKPDSQDGSNFTSLDSVHGLDEEGDSSPGLESEEIEDVALQRSHRGVPSPNVHREIGGSEATGSDDRDAVPEHGAFDDDEEGKLSYRY